MEDVLKKKI